MIYIYLLKYVNVVLIRVTYVYWQVLLTAQEDQSRRAVCVYISIYIYVYIYDIHVYMYTYNIYV